MTDSLEARLRQLHKQWKFAAMVTGQHSVEGADDDHHASAGQASAYERCAADLDALLVGLPERPPQPPPFKNYGVYSPETERELSENYTGYLGDEKDSAAAPEPRQAHPARVLRLLELARPQAERRHQTLKYDEVAGIGQVMRSVVAEGHQGAFATCPHSDCALFGVAAVAPLPTTTEPTT